jgi:hypothetical protein
VRCLAHLTVILATEYVNFSNALTKSTTNFSLPLKLPLTYTWEDVCAGDVAWLQCLALSLTTACHCCSLPARRHHCPTPRPHVRIMRAAFWRCGRQREDQWVLRIVCHGANNVLVKHEGRLTAHRVAADEYCGAQGLYCAEQVAAVCRAAVAVWQLVILQCTAVTPACVVRF